MSDESATAVPAGRFGFLALPPRALAVRVVVLGVVAFVLAWILFLSRNALVNEPRIFIIVGLNGLTLAALYFVVASGFTLIFGLMRVVNMAHGSLYLLGGYFALTFQRKFTEIGADVGFFAQWFAPLVLACLAIGAIGLVMQQLFLRWTQGQDLRQALITIAISIIIADQMLAHYGGIAQEIRSPSAWPDAIGIGVYDLTYGFFRLVLLAIAVAVGLALWIGIKRTRFGMVVRAGVDDRHMVSALGINVQLVFAAAFFVGAMLAGLGGVMGGTMIALNKGQDTAFLLNSLIVVIIGGMGSLGGAAVGALALGLVEQFGAAYLPLGYTNYSVLLVFVLLVLVLAVRPHGLFGRPA